MDFKYLDHISELHNLQDSKKEFQRILIKDTFLKTNDEILSQRRKQKSDEHFRESFDKSSYFPFTGSESVERRRKEYVKI
jgi:hypothetical protein